MKNTEQPQKSNRRTIVSYVLRSGRLSSRLEAAWRRYSSIYMLDLPRGEGSPLSVAQNLQLDQEAADRIWGRRAPLTVEIGSGQGENIVAAARRHPERNYLALEVYRPGLAHTMLMAGKEGLTNLRLAQVNAPDLLEHLAVNLVDELWTFFPDPWPKTKHHKRRLIQPALADAVVPCMQVGGLWRIATDIEDYALHVHEVLDNHPGLRNLGDRTVRLPLGHVGKGTAAMAEDMPHGDFVESKRFEGRIVTNFERKGMQAGRTIHDLTYQAVAVG